MTTTMKIQSTYAQIQNAISELMQTNEQLCRKILLLQASHKLLQLNNDELEAKKLQLNTTISNASVSNNVNVDAKPTQKTSKTK